MNTEKIYLRCRLHFTGLVSHSESKQNMCWVKLLKFPISIFNFDYDSKSIMQSSDSQQTDIKSTSHISQTDRHQVDQSQR